MTDPAATSTTVGNVTFGLNLAGIRLGPQLADVAERAEGAGYDSIWSSEAWGSDAFTPLAFIAARTTKLRIGTAIAQVSARTPAATTMTALTLQQLSGGRLTLGLGVSGPQVVEGWHGVPFRKPLQTTREYVAILRQALSGDSKVSFEGEMFQLPYKGAGSTGLGKPLRSTISPAPETPIYLAAIGPNNVALSAEIADGLLPYLWSPKNWQAAWGESLGAAKPGFAIAPTVFTSLGPDLAACRDAVRGRIAMHVGAMGSKDKNFYAKLVARYGYEAEVEVIQDLFLSGDRAGATAAVTDAIVDELCLVGDAARIKDQLAAWRDGPVTTMILEPTSLDMLEPLAALW
jgi:F420-dependent oxidoreductase-like protein